MITDRLGLVARRRRRRRHRDANGHRLGPVRRARRPVLARHHRRRGRARRAASSRCRRVLGGEWRRSRHRPTRSWSSIPIDGSTNASRGIPWFATSLCFVDDDGPAVALVVNQATDVRYSAERGEGAWCGERRFARRDARNCRRRSSCVSAVPPHDVGWAQFRALGACALDLCALADGVVDGYVDFGSRPARGVGLPRWMADLPRGRHRGRRCLRAADVAHGSPRAPNAGRRRHARAGRPSALGSPAKCVTSARQYASNLRTSPHCHPPVTLVG